MIQELLGGVVEDRKMSMSVSGGLLLDPSTTTSPASSVSSQSPQPSASSSLTSSAAGEQQQQQQQQNLRCPRCDSSNTKFCYYNNYNLTQPRHFCKTCRRYWTKGGALRNVPIGGGCRKTKAVPSIVSAGVVGKCSPAKAKPATTADLLLSRSGLVAGLDRDLLTSSILWPSPHSTSHLMALLRSASVQNPNPSSCSSFNLNSARIKEDSSMLGEHMAPEPATSLSSTQGLSFDPLVQLPFGTALWRNHSSHYSYNHNSRPQAQPLQPQQQDNVLNVHDTIPSSGFQDLQYQRLKSSGNYHNEQLQTTSASYVGSLRNFSCSSVVTTTAPSICTDPVMESTSLPAADFSYWNPSQALSWTDLPAANGAFP